MGPQEQVEACGRDAAALLGRLLGDDLEAVYLGGSGALGGVSATTQSDVDVVAVCAVAPAERLRQAVAFVGQHCGVTASVGVTEVIPGDDVHDLLFRADAAMYRAKTAGGNRVTAPV